MKIKQLVLQDFLPFADSAISKITVNFNSDVQLIIGQNGSGKSVTARQLTTYPSSRSLFVDKKGFKSLTVEKDGFLYRLESEFAKPSSPHAFYEGDSQDNLNVGRTTDIQKEMIVEHLGITPLVDDLIMNRYVFPKWTAARRKEFLMATNPNDVGFIEVHRKKVSSDIKACKNNIARLQSRKIILEQDLLSNESIEDLEKEKTKIENDLTFFQNQIMKIDISSGVIGNSETVTLSANEVKSSLRKIRFSMSRFTHVTRDDDKRTNLKSNLSSQVMSLTNRIQEISDLILKNSDQLHDLEVQYRSLAPDGDLQEIENTISRLEMDRDKFRTTKPDFEISRSDLEISYNTIETLRENLLTFTHLEGTPLYSSKKRNHRQNVLSNAQHRKSRYEMTLSDLRLQYDELSKRHSMSPADIPDSPCSKDKCPLYAHFMEGYETTESRRQMIQMRIRKGERLVNKLTTLINALTAYFERSKPFHDKIQWLISEAQQNPILHSVLKSLDILSTLTSNPNRIYQRLKDKYDHIDQWLKYKEVLSELEMVNTLKQRCMGSQSQETIKLVVDINNLKASLTDLREEMTRVCHKRETCQKVLDDICAYESTKQEVLRLQDLYLKYTQWLANTHEKTKLSYLKKIIEQIRSDTYIRMSEVERILRSQSGLKERYQEEVLNELERIEKELSDLIQIEKTLIDIPKEATIDFLNGIFEQANKIIDAVWTIPLRIEPLNYDSPLNYEFMVSGDNESLREMSECSDGQTEMISLAINLGLRIELGHLDLPLVLDETGRTFGDLHKQNLVLLLRKLLDEKIISQLFFISHHAATHESFSNSETLVIRADGLLLPEVYNQHCEMV